MSCYILNATELSPHEYRQKVFILCEQYAAQRIPEPDIFPAPEGQVYVCVVENAWFDAAQVCLTERDYHTAKYDRSSRPRTWLLMDRATVRELVEWRYKDELALQ